ncbi:hypothetical protein FM037_22320 [Shewanella psychropiezotolerans]|uniref:Uncharacterized protein n=1 Tax=Shewanella psychropiezotolerans TaxID=2593655 RepID=A0ABX5X8B1_9GAMM|nr:hypothetical protein [Shewanella psychropiezotolerans]QDO85491.1 hypothetical protein FM037_22320 [Shewanella psychropiezotolerans]
MYEQVEKPKGNKSKAAANSVAQKKGSVKQGFGFVDNRPGIIEASEKMTTNPDNLNSTTHTQMNQPPADIKQLKRKVDGELSFILIILDTLKNITRKVFYL